MERTETYEYDGKGNIIYRTAYPFILRNVLNDGERTEYVYDGDRLIKAGDVAIYYNGNNLPGNPSSYLTRTLEWSHLRDLRKMDDVSFRYNANGIRSVKEKDNEHNSLLFFSDMIRTKNRDSSIPS